METEENEFFHSVFIAIQAPHDFLVPELLNAG